MKADKSDIHDTADNAMRWLGSPGLTASRTLAEGAFAVKQEQCRSWESGIVKHQYAVKDGEFQIEVSGIRSRIEQDRLALTALSAAVEFRAVYDALVDMRFYSLVPEGIRELQEPDPGRGLKPDGSNAAAVLRTVRRERPSDYERICRLLSRVVPGMRKVEPVSLGPKETIQVLLCRILHRHQIFEDRIRVDRPIRVHRYGVPKDVPKEGQLERAIGLALLRECDAVLVLLDANSDCPAELGPALLARARRAHRLIQTLAARTWTNPSGNMACHPS
jgi:hypothetical protein